VFTLGFTLGIVQSIDFTKFMVTCIYHFSIMQIIFVTETKVDQGSLHPLRESPQLSQTWVLSS
jgi:hypothetical protein